MSHSLSFPPHRLDLVIPAVARRQRQWCILDRVWSAPVRAWPVYIYACMHIVAPNRAKVPCARPVCEKNCRAHENGLELVWRLRLEKKK